MAKRYHRYDIDGEWVPSVASITNVIDKGLEGWWRAKGFEECDKIRDETTSFGDEVRAAIEAVMCGQSPKLEGDVKQAVENFKQWSAFNIQTWIGFEVKVLNRTYKYGGTVDAFAKDKEGKILIVDFKTTKAVQDEHYLRLAAYLNAEEIHKKHNLPIDISKVNEGIILHLERPTLTWQSHPVDTENDYFDVFKACRRIYKWKNGV